MPSLEDLKAIIASYVGESDNKTDAVASLRMILHDLSDTGSQPIDLVRWVPLNMVKANDYNPNAVATNEMRLLHTSISHDGYTQPVVTIKDPDSNKYIIVDGFHRYTIMISHKDIRESTNGLLPIVVIDKPINERMASTVRHNRARGKHSINGMANMVFKMLDNGWTDSEVCNALGLEADELLRLKYITGFAKLFENTDYSRSWQTRYQIRLRKAYIDKHGEANNASS